jgi:hypothetical protein
VSHPTAGARSRRAGNPLRPRKLLDAGWTAAVPVRRARHVIVTRIVIPYVPEAPVEQVETGPVHARQAHLIRWRELQDPGIWRQGRL